jgi:RNA polymerase sigma-54 factor
VGDNLLNIFIDIKEESSNRLEKIEEEIFINDRDLTILMQLDEELGDHFSATEMPMKISLEEIFKNYSENSILAVPTLFENLHQQAAETFDQPFELEIADILIGYMDEDGFLKTSIKEISLSHQLKQETVEKILAEIQSFEPYGVGVSSIQESLLIQLRCLNKEKTLAYRLIKDHYNEFYIITFL